MTWTETRFRRSESALFRIVGPDVLLTRLGLTEVDLLAGSAGLVWQLLDVPRTGSKLVAALVDRYGIPASAIEPVLSSFLEDLERRGWVEVEADVGV